MPKSDYEGDLNQLCSEFDASVWAREFCRITGFVDEGWALSWFANAIMAGYDRAKREGTEHAVE